MTRALRPPPEQETQRRTSGWWRRPRSLEVLAYALVAYVPLLLSERGRVVADTKTYLYLDPSRHLAKAASLWDPSIGLGTVSHQTIGYLFPMGPFFWVAEQIGLPDWVAQRLWLGSILLLAALGFAYLVRTLGVTGPGVVVGAFAYLLSPYVLHYSARISVILLGWAGLPWLLAFTVRALRRGGWKYPALFALAVPIVGSVNATALVYALVAPLLWIPYAIWVSREVSWRPALAGCARMGVLALGTSLWWMAGLWAQGGYGLNILRYTETIETVGSASTAPEVLRGLGYWFFYGRDKLGPWIEASVDYTQNLALLTLSFLVPTLALASAAIVRWRHRAYFAVLVLVGVVLAVGTFPFDDPSPFGALLKSFADRSTAGLALRSSGRAVPLVVLGISVFLALGTTAVSERLRTRGRRGAAVAAPLVVLVLVVANVPALHNDGYYGENLQRGEDIPEYWDEAAAAVDGADDGSRVLAVPGADFAAYRWGNTVDPVLPGLVDRAYVARELIPWGSPESADLLVALDQRLQEGVLEPDAFAEVVRLLAVGDVLVRSDLEVDRFGLPTAEEVWAFVRATPGFGEPRAFGDEIPGQLSFPLLDERALARDPDEPDPPPVALFPVEDPWPIVRAQAADRPMVLAGDGAGVIDVAGLGLVAEDQVILSAPALAGDPDELDDAVGADADLVVTDTNRRRAQRWSTLSDNVGYTETAGEEPLVEDRSDARLPVFPDAGDEHATVVEQVGVERVVATAYGNPIAYTPEDRPARALDGDLTTAWKVGDFDEVVGERIVVELDGPLTTDRVGLVQPLVGPTDRYITEATLRFDGGDATTVELTEASRTEGGQEVTFEPRTFTTLEIEVDATNVGSRPDFAGVSGVGFAEIRLDDVALEEVVRLPSALVDAVGADAAGHRLVYVLTRERTPGIPPREDPEPVMIRAFEVPDPRNFGVTGAARLSPDASDAVIDAVLGVPGLDQGGVVARSSEFLPGDVGSRASAALDGDDATAWSSPLAAPVGQWIEFEAPEELTIDELSLRLVADGRHSVPTRLVVSNAAGEARTVELPALQDGAEPGAVAAAGVELEPLSGRRFRVSVDDARISETIDFNSGLPIALPVAIAELGVEGVRVDVPTGSFPGRCRDDLVSVDDEPLPVRLVGEVDAALRGEALGVERCDASASGLHLAAGEHVVRTADGREGGIDVDQLGLGSEAGGDPMVAVEPGAFPATDPEPPPPGVEVVDADRTSARVQVEAADAPFWLVLGQSRNDGWRAEADGADLGPPRLVDGYANGWLVDPADGDGPIEITLEWVPQRVVRAALSVSGVAALVCVALVGLVWWRRRARAAGRAGPEPPSGAEPPGGGVSLVLPWRDVSAPGSTAVRPVVVLLSAAVLGLVALVAADVAAGMVVAVLTGLALLRPRLRPLLGLGAPVALALAGAYTVVQQARYDYPPLFEWPGLFERVHVLGLLAVLLVVADVVVERVVRRETEARRGAGGIESAAPLRSPADDEPDRPPSG